MFGIPKFFGWRGRSLNLAISSLGSLDFLYDTIQLFTIILELATNQQQDFLVMIKVLRVVCSTCPPLSNTSPISIL